MYMDGFQCSDLARTVQTVNGIQPVKLLAITSGKGGVGKSTVAINLSVALARLGRQVLLLDADFALANVNILLGLEPGFDISHVIGGQRSLDEILVQGPTGVRVVPSTSGHRPMPSLGAYEHAGLIHAFSDLSQAPDVLVVDTASGVDDDVLNFVAACHEVIVVVCDEPASIVDAQILIESLNLRFRIRRFRILANMVDGMRQGRELYLHLLERLDAAHNVTLEFMGVVPYDGDLRRAVQRQMPVVDAYPNSNAASAFRYLAERADRWPFPEDAGGRLEFFVERLLYPRAKTIGETS
jgi:flagellar biosynthesis protein FlhG